MWCVYVCACSQFKHIVLNQLCLSVCHITYVWWNEWINECDMKFKREKKPHKVLKFCYSIQKKRERKTSKQTNENRKNEKFVWIVMLTMISQPLIMQMHGYFISIKPLIDKILAPWTANTIDDSINRQFRHSSSLLFCVALLCFALLWLYALCNTYLQLHTSRVCRTQKRPYKFHILYSKRSWWRRRRRNENNRILKFHHWRLAS